MVSSADRLQKKQDDDGQNAGLEALKQQSTNQ